MSSAFILLMICVILLCIVLVFLVLSQNPKGGGLTSTFGGSGTQMFGVQNTNAFMDKATWTVASVIVLIVIFSGIMISDPSIVNIKSKKETKKPQTEQPTQNPKTQK